jgi:hypothetical protein
MKWINMREKIYNCENIYLKGPKNIIWSLLVPSPFFEMVPSGTTHGYFYIL